MALREFKLLGNNYTSEASGIITIGGVEVFNGPFICDNETNTPIATGSADVAGGGDTLPVVITVTSGQMGIGMFQWNYATEPNRNYTSEQIARLSDPSTTIEQKLEICNTVATPPFSPEEIALLSSTDPIDLPAQIDILVAHQASTVQPYSDLFAYGDNEETERDNRNNCFINGAPITVPEWYAIWLDSTLVLTFDTIIFGIIGS